MSDDPALGDHLRALSELSPRQRRRLYRTALLRPTFTAVLLIVGYFLLPLENTGGDSSWLLLVIGLLVVAAVMAWQLWEIMRADYPLLQGVEAMAAVVPAYLLVFSATYVLMSGSAPGSFSEHLTHMAGLYFTVVVFSTVGFGDITPLTDPSRALVTGQIICNLVVIALLARVLVAVVRRSQARRAGSRQG